LLYAFSVYILLAEPFRAWLNTLKQNNPIKDDNINFKSYDNYNSKG